MTMDSTATTDPAVPARLRDRVPGWLQALAVYLALRAVTAIFTLIIATTQVENLWTKASPGYFDFAGIWDGSWYQRVAENGYPTPLPTDYFGEPVQSEWAFFPVYPVTVRLVMVITGLEFRIAAPTVSLLLGCAAAVVCYRLFLLKASHGIALAGVAVIAAWPPSPVMQYAYTESTCVLALAGVLYHLVRREYYWAMPWAVMVGLSRPVGMALVAALAWILLVRWWRRREDPLPLRDIGAIVALGAVTVASSMVMLVAAAIAGDRLDAYTAVQQAWRAQEGMEYFTPWLFISRVIAGPVWGPIGLAVFVVALVGILVSRPARRLGPEMHGWCLAYVAYLAAVTDPFGQVFRLTVLLFPLALAFAEVLRRRFAVELWLVISLGLQLWWIATLWRFTPPADIAP